MTFRISLCLGREKVRRLLIPVEGKSCNCGGGCSGPARNVGQVSGTTSVLRDVL